MIHTMKTIRRIGLSHYVPIGPTQAALQEARS